MTGASVPVSEGRAEAASGTTVGRLLVVLILALPWAYGAVHAPARGAYVVAVALLFAVVVAQRIREGVPPARVSAPAGLLLAALAWAALTVVPLPAGVLAVIAPESHRIAVASFAEAGLQPPAWHPIAVAPRDAAGGFATAVAHLMVFLLAARTLSGRRGARLLATVLAISGAAMALLAIAQEALDAKRIYFFALERGQFYGTFVNGNHAATFLAVCAVAALGLLLREREPGRKLVWGLAGVLASVAAMYSLSRGGIVALTAGLVVFLGGAIAVQAAARKQSPDEIGRFFRRNMVPMMLVGLAAFYLSWLGPRKIGRELATLAALDLPRDYRTQVWSDSIDAFGDRPLTGAGGGTFGHVFPQYRSFPADVTTEMAESDWVQLLVENGAVGFLLVGAAIALALGRFGAVFVKDPLRFSGAHWGLATALFVVVAHGMVDFPARIPAIGAIAAACLGVVVGAVERAKRDHQPREGDGKGRGRGRGLRAGWLVLPVVAVGAFVHSRGESGEALRDEPADAREWIRFARRSEGEQSAAAYRIAARLDPADPVVQRAAALGLAREGDADGATRILGRARELVAGAGDPWQARAAQLALDLAEQLLWTDADAAARTLERVPPSPRRAVIAADVAAARAADIAGTRAAVDAYLAAAQEAERDATLAGLARRRALLLTVNALPRLEPADAHEWIRTVALADDPGRVLRELHSLAIAGALDSKRLWGDGEWSLRLDTFERGAPRLSRAKEGSGEVVVHEIAGGAEHLGLRYPGESVLSDLWVAPLAFRTEDRDLVLTARVKASGRLGNQFCVRVGGRTIFAQPTAQSAVSDAAGGWRTVAVSGLGEGAPAGKPVVVEGWCFDTRGRPGPFLIDDVELTLP